MSIIFFKVDGSTGRGYDADTLLWEAAVIANGGSVSLARRIIVDQFIFDEKAAGIWALTDDYWLFWGENAPQALTSLKQRRLATAVNSPVHTVDRDYTFDGLTNYIDLGFKPLSNSIVAAYPNVGLGIYARANNTGTGTAIGVSDGTNVLYGLSRNGASGQARLVGALASLTLPAADSRGYISMSTTDAINIVGSKHGVRMTPTVVVPGAAFPNINMFAGARNTSGAATNFRASQIGFLRYGAALTEAQDLAHYTAVQAMATSIGANV